MQEIGNNPYISINKIKMDSVEVNNYITYNERIHSMPVYRTKYFSIEEAKEKGVEILRAFGLRVDDKRVINNGETLLMYSSDNEKNNIWIDYLGGSYLLTLSIFLNMDSDRIIGASEEEVRNAIPFEIPENSLFGELGNGIYQYKIKTYDNGDIKQIGAMRCILFNEGMGQIDDRVKELEYYKEFETYDIDEAIEQIYAGKWSYYKEISEISILSYKVDYCVDTKGFYQPNYVFLCKIDGEESEIWIPAIK